tara:strand:- start:11588 stop:12130 length:543 start_codon:yes stop_codon:yes gene_type:complete
MKKVIFRVGDLVESGPHRAFRSAGPLFPARIDLDGTSIAVDTPQELLDLLATVCGAAPEFITTNLRERPMGHENSKTFEFRGGPGWVVLPSVVNGEQMTTEETEQLYLRGDLEPLIPKVFPTVEAANRAAKLRSESFDSRPHPHKNNIGDLRKRQPGAKKRKSMPLKTKAVGNKAKSRRR